MGTLQVNGNISATGTISASSFLGNASSATYTYQFRVSATNPCTVSTDSNTGIFNVPDSRIYWITQTGTVIDQLSQWGYILDIGTNAERHQIWMTQSSGDMAHRGGNSNGWNGTWRILLDSSNYTSYVPTKTGSGASGTWGINITGTWQGYNPSSFALASHSHNYLPLSGGTMSGALNFANGTLNLLGDDVYFGDQNVAGAFCIKGANGTTNLRMIQHSGTAAGTISFDGSSFTISNYINGTIANATKLVTARSIFGRSFDGTADIVGRAVHYGTYTSTSGERYHYSALEIRENDLVVNNQSDIGYAPAIGFHWRNMCAGSLCYNGIFHFKTQAWERATIDANLNGWAASAGNADTVDGYHASSFALASHSHSYLPLSGGTITGRVLFTSHNWTSAPDVDNAPLCFDYKIDAITSSTYYKPWFGGSHGISGQGYCATITAGLYHTNDPSRGGFYIGASWDMNPSDTFYYFSRDGHFITPRLVTNNYGSSFPSTPYNGEVFFKI